MLGKRMRHIKRYQDVAKILTRHGFGFFVEEAGLLHKLSLPKRILRKKQGLNSLEMGERIRQAIEELGPTFIKLGQMASTRADLIPEKVLRELAKLQDNVPAVPFAQVAEMIEEELGAPLTEVFAWFDQKAIAAASIGQVYRARLHTGELVAVKVQRPQIRETIETDLEILLDLASLAEKHLKQADNLQIQDVIEEFAKSLRNELDYSMEARNAERIAKQFQDDPLIHLPVMYGEYSTKTVLTMEFVEGVKLNQIEELEKMGCDRKAVAEQLVQALFHQVLIEGFFHADPHPGNVFIQPGGVMTFIDFGMACRLSDEMRENFALLIIAMMRHSTKGTLKAILRFGIVPDDVDLQRLTREIDELRDKYMHVPMSEISLGEAVNDLLRIAFRHRIRVPSELTLLAKCMATLEGIVEKLDPELSIMDLAEPFGLQLLEDRYKPKKLAGRIWGNVTEYSELLVSLPKQMKQLMRNMVQGRLRVETHIPELEDVMKKLDRVGNQISFSVGLLAFSIVMAALIVAAALGHELKIFFGYVSVVDFGFVVATLMMIVICISIYRSGRF